MSGEFSLADAEATFGPAAMERVDRSVAEAPVLGAELRERLRSLFVSARVMRAEDSSAAEAA